MEETERQGSVPIFPQSIRRQVRFILPTIFLGYFRFSLQLIMTAWEHQSILWGGGGGDANKKYSALKKCFRDKLYVF